MSQSKRTERGTAGVVLVPGGTFNMGAVDGYIEEAPPHEVTVPSFWMDTTPVTNGDYQRFCDETERAYPTAPRWPEMPDALTRYPDHPVVNINYDDAADYAAWCGKRLPTEAEWEYAARAGQASVWYPWGNEAPDRMRAVFGGRDTPVAWRDPLMATGHRFTAPVASYPPNPFGLYDMAGNVWEWCDNWFYQYPWEDLDEGRVGEGWGLQRVVRGGAWYSPARDLRLTRRLRVHGGVGGNGTGFRCARDIDGSRDAPPTAPTLPPQDRPDPGAWDALIRATPHRMERGTELCLGCGPSLTEEEADRVRALGFTSVEQYVHWGTIENAAEGAFDFSHWDSQVEVLHRHGLKWVPFLIAGPAYSLPDWFRGSANHRGAVCLEHRLVSKIQSVFDRSFDRHVVRFLSAFSEHYRDSGVIEALLLGITGDFGEAIYPVTGTVWTQVAPGPYHTHPGYWCGDSLAEADFREAMVRRYDGDLGQLNAAWATRFIQASEITLPDIRIPDGIEAFRADEPTPPGTYPMDNPQDRRRWLDFIGWYRGGMNRLAEMWMRTAREFFPDHPIYLCTGGDAPPQQGAHFGDQCRVAAAVNGGVRITNEASNYPHNFAITRWVTSAGRFYGAYTGIEPAGGVNEFGVTCRIYNAVASGAKNLHFYEPNIVHYRETIEAWHAGFDAIGLAEPLLNVAFFLPDTSIMLGDVPTGSIFEQVGRLRDLTDLEYVDDAMVEAGILDQMRVLVLAHASVVEQRTLDRIAKWLDAGGTLLLMGGDPIESVEGARWTPAAAHAVIEVDRMTGEPGDETIAEQIASGLAQYGITLVDGRLDNVYVSQVSGALLVLNHGASDVTREFALSGSGATTVTLAGNSITTIPIE